MRKVITYGTYDLLHHGHLNLLRRAKELGDYLIVGITSDSFDVERGKLNVQNNVLERIDAVKKTGYADEVIIESYIGQKIDDIQRYDVDIFAIGSDWEGQFDYLKEYCEVIYLPRTEGISSTQIRMAKLPSFKLGIIGTGRIAKRFVPEVKCVNNVECVSVYNPDESEAEKFREQFQLENAFSNISEFVESIDAVYIAAPHAYHYQYAKECLLNGKHVLCEIPLVLNRAQAEELYQVAEENNLVLLEASKTAFCPGFTHLVNLVKSGAVGDVVDITASLSKLVPRDQREFDYRQFGGSMTELSPLPILAIIKILGMDIRDIRFFSKVEDKVDVFTKGVFVYDSAVATITLGLGVKTEGNLVISGTKGYVYVPAPWWKTDYFELRFEDQNKNKKFFYSFDGEGLRYEVQEFISMLANNRRKSFRINPSESVAIARIIEDHRKGEKVTLLK